MAIQHAAELVLDAGATLGEGPCWDAERQRLLWVDIEAGLVHRYDPASGEDETHDAGRRVSAVVPHAEGGLVLVCQGGLHLLGEFGGTLAPLAPIDPDDPQLRPNDAKCDPAGRLWIGTMALDGRVGHSSLSRLDRAGGELERVLDGVTISNGLGWSPDGATMYYVDTPLGRVDVFDFDPLSGTPANRRTLAEIAPPGQPDGLCVDAEGCVWVALWGGSAVLRLDPEGDVVAEVPLPVPYVTSCCFGGPDLADLYVTTARWDGPAGTPAGGLFRVCPGVRGLPSAAFAA